MSLKLYTHPALFSAQKIIIAAQYAGVDLDIVTDADAKKLKGLGHPGGKVPVLVAPEGVVFQSNAITRYIARLKPDANLFGENLFDSALVESWLDFCTNEIEVPATALVYPILGWMTPNSEMAGKATGDLKKAVMLLESHLKSKTYLVGRKMTIADIAVATALILPMKFIYDEKGRKAFPCVTRWFTTCCAQPQFEAVVGKVNLCKKAMKPPAAAASSKKKDEKKTTEKKKEKKAAPPPAPAPKKKAKHPCELLPPCDFILDAWKKQYSNAPGGDCYKAMPWFWDNHKPDGYSLWYATYNYNEENKVGFMVSNLIQGFVQRCDEVRKYAFGTMQIIGTEDPPKMEVVGCWLMRGQSIQPLIDCNPDAEYYTFTKLPDLDDATKAKVAELWCACETVEGKPVIDCKVFK